MALSSSIALLLAAVLAVYGSIPETDTVIADHEPSTKHDLTSHSTDSVVPEELVSDQGFSCNSKTQCTACLKDSACKWCADESTCQSKFAGIWNTCAGPVTVCAAPVPDQHDISVLTPEQWKIAREASQLATLGSTALEIVKAAGRGTVLREFINEGMAFRIFQSTDQASCYIVFRGTELKQGDAFENLWADIHATHYQDHELWSTNGYTGAMDKLSDTVKASIDARYQDGSCTKKTTYITGHSLGGVLAQLTATRDLAGFGGDQSLGGVITFGAPRAWMQGCDQVLLRMPTLNWRFVRHVSPGSGFSGYDAIPQLIWATDENHANHCANINIALNENFVKDQDENNFSVLNPTLLAPNAPNNDITGVLDTPKLFGLWWIHDSNGYNLAVQKYFGLSIPSEGAGAFKSGKGVSLRGYGMNWCSDRSGASVECNVGSAQGWERFTVEDASNGQIALIGGGTQKYCAVIDNAGTLKCNQDTLGDGGKFTVGTVGSKNQISLKVQGKYCSAEGGDGSLKCNRPAVAAWETFDVVSA